METQTYRHPEWKRLYDALLPHLVTGAVFDYETIRTLMDLDARTANGRRQFNRCAKELTKNRQFQFECVRGVGYRIVAANESPARMHNRIGRAKRRLLDAAFIGIHTKLDELTEQQRAANADVLARIGRLAEAVAGQRKEIRAVIVAATPERLPHPMILGGNGLNGKVD